MTSTNHDYPYADEGELRDEVLLKHSRGDTRLFRMNSGLAWQGQVIEHTPRRLVMLNPRPIKLGFPGMSDLVGWSPHGDVAVYTVAELKFGRTRTTPEQTAFVSAVLRAGGRAGFARSADEVADILAMEPRRR